MTPASIRDGFEALRTDQRAAAARRRRGVPVGVRLAGRHQRHARDDRVQLEGRRLLQDHRGPGADADAGDPGRARGAHQDASSRATTGKCTARSPARAGEYPGRWFDEKFARRKEDDADARAERLWDAGARRSHPRTSASASRASSPRKASRPPRLSPLLYDLTSLQREANGRFGFSAARRSRSRRRCTRSTRC